MARKHYFHKRENLETKYKVSKFLKTAIFWVIGVFLSIGLAYLISSKAVLKTAMNGESMKPTLESGMVLITNKWAYVFQKPKRFDVIVYKQSNKEHSYFEVKRVIGLPGEKVFMKEGEIFIDNKKLDEIVSVIPNGNGGLAEEGVELAENEFFVLGDNREESEDSRFASVGNILRSEIIGKAVFVEKPFTLVSSLNLVGEKK